MSPTHNQKFELFDAYRKGTLSEKEMHDFSNKRLTDAAFDKSYSDYLISSEVIKQYEINNIRNILEGIDYTKYNDKGNNGKSKWIISGIALLAGISVFVFLQTKENKTSESNLTTKATNTFANEKKQELKTETYTTNTGITKSNSSSNDANSSKENKSIAKVIEVVPNEIGSIVAEDKKTVTKTETITTGNSESKSNQITPTTICDITCYVATTGTCPEKNSGEIKIDRIKGGNTPYKIQLQSGDETLNYNANTDLLISNLNIGNYSIVITDKTGDCSKAINQIKVEKLNNSKCITESKFVINTSLAEVWTCPSNVKAKTIEVKTFGGTVVYKQTISDNDTIEWNGSNANGSPLSPGVYFFTIENKNGELVHQGTITIVN